MRFSSRKISFTMNNEMWFDESSKFLKNHNEIGEI